MNIRQNKYKSLTQTTSPGIPPEKEQQLPAAGKTPAPCGSLTSPLQRRNAILVTKGKGKPVCLLCFVSFTITHAEDGERKENDGEKKWWQPWLDHALGELKSNKPLLAEKTMCRSGNKTSCWIRGFTHNHGLQAQILLLSNSCIESPPRLRRARVL